MIPAESPTACFIEFRLLQVPGGLAAEPAAPGPSHDSVIMIIRTRIEHRRTVENGATCRRTSCHLPRSLRSLSRPESRPRRPGEPYPTHPASGGLRIAAWYESRAWRPARLGRVLYSLWFFSKFASQNIKQVVVTTNR